jgi:hypothetical protein
MSYRSDSGRGGGYGGKGGGSRRDSFREMGSNRSKHGVQPPRPQFPQQYDPNDPLQIPTIQELTERYSIVPSPKNPFRFDQAGIWAVTNIYPFVGLDAPEAPEGRIGNTFFRYILDAPSLFFFKNHADPYNKDESTWTMHQDAVPTLKKAAELARSDPASTTVTFDTDGRADVVMVSTWVFFNKYLIKYWEQISAAIDAVWDANQYALKVLVIDVDNCDRYTGNTYRPVPPANCLERLNKNAKLVEGEGSSRFYERTQNEECRVFGPINPESGKADPVDPTYLHKTCEYDDFIATEITMLLDELYPGRQMLVSLDPMANKYMGLGSKQYKVERQYIYGLFNTLAQAARFEIWEYNSPGLINNPTTLPWSRVAGNKHPYTFPGTWRERERKVASYGEYTALFPIVKDVKRLIPGMRLMGRQFATTKEYDRRHPDVKHAEFLSVYEAIEAIEAEHEPETAA